MSATLNGVRPLSLEEIEAIERSLPDVGMYVAGVENGRPLSEWGKDEILKLILTTVKAYQSNIDKIVQADDIPF